MSLIDNHFDDIDALVRTVAAKFAKRGVEYEDLVQEGWVRIIEKEDSFDPTRSKFTTWVWALARNRMIDVVTKKFKKVVTLPKTQRSELADDPAINLSSADSISVFKKTLSPGALLLLEERSKGMTFAAIEDKLAWLPRDLYHAKKEVRETCLLLRKLGLL